jgi:hypothetical protein
MTAVVDELARRGASQVVLSTARRNEAGQRPRNGRRSSRNTRVAEVGVSSEVDHTE